MTRLLLLFLTLSAAQCRQSAEAPLFRLLGKEKTGLNFDNTPRQSAELNVFNYMYFFNGGGVAAGDFNRDGRIDLFFTANTGPDKLFLNEGDLRFRDVSTEAGINPVPEPPLSWKTGVSVVDINCDGLLDLYVSQVGEYKTIKGRNRLLVCQKIENGIPIFKEDAAAYGLDLVGFGTQAAFFDYDGDGDLDCYQLNHSLHQNGTFGPRRQFEGVPHPLSGDRLLENRDGHFYDITQTTGIQNTVLGYGLGIALGDLNLDGWTDLYIGNDFHENDYLYYNTAGADGKRIFREAIAAATPHTSRFSMGVDIGDLNNDAWSEIISLDMEPEDPAILKASLGEDGFAVYQMKLGYGYHNQYARNALQFNLGNGCFQEIAQFAGVSATDWSWSPLFMDFDSDGQKDLFISNGIPRRMNDVDFVKFQEEKGITTPEKTPNNDLAIVEKMPRIKLPNKFYRQNAPLQFEDGKNRIENDRPGFSNGAVAADLDNDGDLDVVVNNIEDEPFIYQNLDRENGRKGSFLSLSFTGSPQNPNAVGTRVVVYKKTGERLVAEFYPVRGYQSSAMTPLHLGVGDAAQVDSVLLIWPDRRVEKLTPVFNQTTTMVWKPGLPLFDFTLLQQKKQPPYQFQDITDNIGLNYTHLENPFIEFNREALMPHMVSAEGPAVATGDVNGDGLDDVYFGASKFGKRALYLQQKNGQFILRTPEIFLRDSIFEDVDATFADLDNDGDLDLLLAAGGNEWRARDEAMKQRYYLNDGKGNFERREFPGAFATASCVLPCDFNGDGLLDVFIGARAVPWSYGLTPASYLFQNKGQGVFEDVAPRIGGGMHQAGLVKNGAWADLDADGDQDLMLAAEWSPVLVFKNQGGQFEKVALSEHSGWWNFVQAADFDGDGDLDLLAGNRGVNGRFHPSPREPLRLYVADFDQNGQVDQILSYYLQGREIPFATFEELTKTLPALKKKFLYARDFAKATMSELFGKKNLETVPRLEANTLESMYFENTGNFKFSAHPLPDALQWSSLQACALADPEGDGRTEALLGGNFYECNIEMGRYDAFSGHVLRIGERGSMQVYPLGKQRVDAQVRRIRPLKTTTGTAWIFARNNAPSVVLAPE